MNITRTGKFVNGKLVYDPPFTMEERRKQEQEFVEMCRSRRAPMMKGSDRALLEGDIIHHGLQGHTDVMQEHMVKVARKAGINITGKVYKSGLADQRGPADPEAWVSSVDEIRDVCKRRNRHCRGIVENVGHEVAPTPDVPLSDDLIRESVPEFLKTNPELARDPEGLRHAIIEKHGPQKKRKREFKNIHNCPAPQDAE